VTSLLIFALLLYVVGQVFLNSKDLLKNLHSVCLFVRFYINKERTSEKNAETYTVYKAVILLISL